MTKQEVGNYIKLFIMKMIQDGELDENILHTCPDNNNSIFAINDKIENQFPGYSEKDKTFTPQKVIEKTF